MPVGGDCPDRVVAVEDGHRALGAQALRQAGEVPDVGGDDGDRSSLARRDRRIPDPLVDPRGSEESRYSRAEAQHVHLAREEEEAEGRHPEDEVVALRRRQESQEGMAEIPDAQLHRIVLAGYHVGGEEPSEAKPQVEVEIEEDEDEYGAQREEELPARLNHEPRDEGRPPGRGRRRGRRTR